MFPYYKLNFNFSEIFRFRFDINVLGFSADGDPRLLSSMRLKVNFNLNELNAEGLKKFFDCYYRSANGAVFIQDMIHIITKLRNRLLKLSIILPMRNYQISVAHIKIYK